MPLPFFFKGFIIGISIAAPVGPIGVLCIRRTLSEGRTSGLITGLGAATADAIYGSIAGFGLTFVSNFLINQQSWLRLIGGLFLCYLGLKTFWTRPTHQVALTDRKGFIPIFTSTFFLTLTNPMTILSFAAIFAGLGVGSTHGNYVSAAVMVLGVFTGSLLWWYILSRGVSFLGDRFNGVRLHWIHWLSGVILLVFSAVALLGWKR
jgi:threonine/homoserine/homoserine lactone efflux protein